MDSSTFHIHSISMLQGGLRCSSIILLYQHYTMLHETMGSGAAQIWGWENERWWEPAHSSLTAFPGSQYCDQQHTGLLSPRARLIMNPRSLSLMLITWNGQQEAFLCIKAHTALFHIMTSLIFSFSLCYVSVQTFPQSIKSLCELHS